MNFILSLSLMLAQLASPASASLYPQKQTQSLIKTLQAIQSAEPGKPLSKKSRLTNADVYKTLDQFIDFKALAEAPLSNYKNSFSSRDLRKIQGHFREAMRLVAYQKASILLNEAELTFRPTPTPPSNDVTVDLYVESEDLEMELVFHWGKQAKKLVLIDMSFDGESLVEDYKNQFGKVIKTEGPKALMAKLEKRLKEVKKKSRPQN